MIDAWELIGTWAELCRDLVQIGVSLLIQSTAILLLGLLVGRWVAGRGPEVRVLIYRATLAAVVASASFSVLAAGYVRPFWSVSLPGGQFMSGAVPPREAAVTAPTAHAAQARPPAASSGAASRAASTSRRDRHDHIERWAPAGAAGAGHHNPFEAQIARASAGPARLSGAGWLYLGIVGLWAAGSTSLLVWLLLCQVSLFRLRRSSVPAREDATVALLRELCASIGTRAPELRVSRSGRTLFLTGLWRPTIFLPSSYPEDLSEQELRAVLAHELFHMARGDCAWHLVSRLACAVGWVQPLLWSICRRLEEASEELCDHAVVAGHCPAPAYARCLLQLAERLAPSPQERAVGVGVLPFRSSLGQRIRQILDHSARQAPAVSSRIRAATALGAALTVALSLAAVAAPVPIPRGVKSDQEAARALFRADARLDVTVTLAHQDQPISEVLAALERETGVPLKASRETADDRVTLFLDQRPAAEALALLAGHFEFRWYRDGDGYELLQSLASRQREAALRERELREQLAAIHAQIEQEVQKAAVPPAPLLARLRAIRPKLQNAALDRATRERLQEEASALLEMLRPVRAPAVAIYRSLTPEQARKLLEGREIRLSSADATMHPAVAHLVHEAEAILPELHPWGWVPGSRVREDWPPKQAEARIRLIDLRLFDDYRDAMGPPPPGGSHLRLEVTLPGGPGTGTQRWSSRYPWSVESRRPEEKPPAVKTRTEDPALTRAVELTFPAPGPSFLPVDHETFAREYPVFGVWPARMRSIGEIAAALHQATGLEVVADSFVRARVPAGLVAGRRPVVEILDAVATALDYTWRKEGDLIFFRNRRYYRDRPEEVPQPILLPWRERIRRQGAATLEDLGALAAALTEPQTRGIHQYWGWYFEGLPTLPPNRGAGGFYGSSPHFRFWGSLSPQQRRVALAGEILPVARLSPQQRQAFEAAFSSNDLHPGWDPPSDERSREPTPGDLMLGAFRIEAGSLLPEGGSPLKTISYTFRYYQPNKPAPARSAEIQIIAPQPQQNRS